MEFARPILWNVPHWAELTLYALAALTVLSFLFGCVRRIGRWRFGQPEPGHQAILSRTGRFIRYGLLQWRLASDSFAVVMHLAIFWAMVVLFIGTALATVDQDVTHLFFDYQFLAGNVYRVYELALDVFGVVLLVGLGLAAYRRYVKRPPHQQIAAAIGANIDAFYLLAVLALIAVTGFLAEGLRIAQGMQLARVDPTAENIAWMQAAPWAPVGYLLGSVFATSTPTAISSAHQVVWWLHAVLALGFIVSIPFTKAFHLIASPLNTFFRNTADEDSLVPVVETGAARLTDFTWRQLLQVDACTLCGKCQEVCPLHIAGSKLSPAEVIQKLEHQLWIAKAGNGESLFANRLGGDGLALAPAELWACCTCRACEERCPVMVEHPRMIVDMRRALVNEGNVDEGLQDALQNLTRYGNSFGQSPRKRTQWAKDLPLALVDARREPVDWLWFVGDYASYHPSSARVSRLVALLLQDAGIDFGVLQHDERSAGNDVRRVGEEGLFEMLAEKNAAALAKAQFRRIFTTDPHTLHALKHEYRRFGLQELVQHYSQLFDDLIANGTFIIRHPLKGRAVYHDPCYLGRYNGVFDPPRRVVEATGMQLMELPRNRENSFCCGAGGGKIWMDDEPGLTERPAVLRIREALDVAGVTHFVVACPKDLGMFEDAVKTVGAEDRLKVVDLAELVFDAVRPNAQSQADEVNETKPAEKARR